MTPTLQQLRACAADVATPSALALPKSPACLLPQLILTSFGLFWFMLLAKKEIKFGWRMVTGSKIRFIGSAIGTVRGVGGEGIFVTIFPSSLDLLKN
ncbi:hypothetical protein VNO80_19259 [Phaseolus coccineus]|uniref:Uncharacterized protein n=1 Tax=Phaseolus coccineus TaxID=3886 RepID=A0AAN9QZL9_PHACN